MRIVGGKWKRQRLFELSKSPVVTGLRPTADRVRETMFNILQHGIGFEIKESRVLDLFCGTGALGFEALSRGAEHVCFVDKKKFGHPKNCIRRQKNCLDVQKMF